MSVRIVSESGGESDSGSASYLTDVSSDSDSSESDAVSDGDDILVSRDKATEYTKLLRDFIIAPAGAPTETNNLFEWCKFFDTAMKWSQLYLSPLPVADAGVRKFATLVAQTIRRINIQFPTEWTLVMATDNRVFVAEIMWNAYVRVNTVASEFNWIRDFGTTSPMDPSFYKLNLFMNNIPFVRMSMTEYYANLTRICADWKGMEYSPELRTYMELMEARACMFISHAYSEYVVDHRIYRSLARGAKGNVTIEDIRAEIERKKKAAELKAKKASILEGAADISAADVASMASANDTGADGVAREVSVNVQNVDGSGSIHIDVKESGAASFSEMRRAGELDRAVHSMHTAISSGDNKRVESAMKQWEAATHTEYAAFRFLNENKRLHLEMLRKTGRPLMTMVNNFHFVLETYAIFSEMTRDVMEHTRFKKAMTIDSIDAFVDGFSSTVKFTREDIEQAYEHFSGFMDIAIEAISEARWEERITKMYFETCMHVGERSRHLRLQKDADPEAHSVIHASDAVRFNKVSVAAQRRILDMWNDKKDTPPFVLEMIEVYALDYRFLEYTNVNFTDSFASSGAQVRLTDPPKHPVLVTSFGHHRVFDNGVLITFTPFRLSIMYWMFRVMFDPATMGIINEINIKEIFHQMFPNLGGHVGKFLAKKDAPRLTAPRSKKSNQSRAMVSSSSAAKRDSSGMVVLEKVSGDMHAAAREERRIKKRARREAECKK